MTLFDPLPPETRRLLNGVPALIDKTFPLPGRFRSALPTDVTELSRLLTSGRGERGLSYLGRPNLLSAYLRYFLPWNLYRLCRLLPGLDITLAANDVITDIGCGPLTFTVALWICRPDLRTVPLEFYCIDRSGPALETGKSFFAALAADTPWKIHTVKGDIANIRFDARTKPAALVCAVNVFNEMYGDISRSGTSVRQLNAEKSVRILENYAAKASANAVSVLVAEPGFPRCGEFISIMRNIFLERGRRIVSPCPHDAACPFSKERWCHFAFETKDAPAALHKLSQAAGLPKERAVLSFLFAEIGSREWGVGSGGTTAETILRVISDAFPLPSNRYGRYCCSRHGLVLLAGGKSVIEKSASGELVNASLEEGRRDSKSGALIAEYRMTV
jgi:SAM-dependent methyltransferase